ncbi:MAG: hypothetical protein JNK33_05135 [Candidatus Doudnabacteria bacterium]|nr:hypothetical protein [Candidatus Doudnabacteria bacterium]
MTQHEVPHRSGGLVAGVVATQGLARLRRAVLDANGSPVAFLRSLPEEHRRDALDLIAGLGDAATRARAQGTLVAPREVDDIAAGSLPTGDYPAGVLGIPPVTLKPTAAATAIVALRRGGSAVDLTEMTRTCEQAVSIPVISTGLIKDHRTREELVIDTRVKVLPSVVAHYLRLVFTIDGSKMPNNIEQGIASLRVQHLVGFAALFAAAPFAARHMTAKIQDLDKQQERILYYLAGYGDKHIKIITDRLVEPTHMGSLLPTDKLDGYNNIDTSRIRTQRREGLLRLSPFKDALAGFVLGPRGRLSIIREDEDSYFGKFSPSAQLYFDLLHTYYLGENQRRSAALPIHEHINRAVMRYALLRSEEFTIDAGDPPTLQASREQLEGELAVLFCVLYGHSLEDFFTTHAINHDIARIAIERYVELSEVGADAGGQKENKLDINDVYIAAKSLVDNYAKSLN